MINKTVSCKSICSMLCISIAFGFFSGGCASHNLSNTPYNHRQCMDTVPKKVKGLKILSGPRTEQSIILDMVPVTCYGHVIYHKMKTEGQSVKPGTLAFKIAVEYTGEVYKVDVEEDTIQSARFRKRLIELVMNTDFVGWQRSDIDTVFVYPMVFSE